MEEAIKKNSLVPLIFPKLDVRHAEQYKAEKENTLLYHKQIHERYMYMYFSVAKLSFMDSIKISKGDGIVASSTPIGSFDLKESANEEIFYQSLMYAPTPFVFIPKSPVSCRGARVFTYEKFKGILMNLNFAVNVGIDFLAADYLMRRDVSECYVGLLYDTVL